MTPPLWILLSSLTLGIATGPPRPGDSMWMIDTREISQPTAADPGMQIRLAQNGGWVDTDLEKLVDESTAATHTVLFVHGYDFSPEKAERMSWAMYHALAADLAPHQHVRFITWSWPSTAMKFRLLRDMKSKIRRADAEAYFLAWFLSRVDVDTVIGTAMGARIVGGSLQLLAGESPTLNTDVTRSTRQEQLTAVLISAAIDANWLQADRPFGDALGQVKQLVLINNSLDPLLANFAMVSRADSDALGVVGIAMETLNERGAKIQQHDVAASIGRRHGIENYLASPRTRSLLQASTLA